MVPTNLNTTVGNGASFAARKRGWIAPVSAQPLFAGFFGLNTLSNLAVNGVAPTVVGTQPVFTDGVAGSNLPFLTFSPMAQLKLQFPYSRGFTILSVCTFSLPSDQQNNTVLASSYGSASGNVVQIRSNSANTAHFYQAVGSNYALTEMPDTAALTKWGLHVFTATITNPTSNAPTITLTNKNLTTGQSDTSASVTGGAPFVSADSLFLGADANGGGVGSVNINSFIAFDGPLSDADLTSVAQILRSQAAAWGVSV